MEGSQLHLIDRVDAAAGLGIRNGLGHALGPIVPLGEPSVVRCADQDQVGRRRGAALGERMDVMKLELVRRAAAAAILPDECATPLVPTPDLRADRGRNVATLPR